jgi:predicted amidohydrolase YtcJ
LMMGDGAFMDSPYYGRTYNKRFRIGGVKLTLDGSPQGKTSWLTKPYFVPPAGQKKDYVGYPALKDAQVEAAIEQAFAKGWQVLVHTNGDAAVDQFLNAVDIASKKIPGTDRRPVAIHAQTARLDQIDRMKALGVIPSFFPMHTFYWGDWHRDSVLGPERAANISPTGWALQRGMIFTSHHDAPVVFPDAMRVLSSTVNRTTRTGQVLGPDQRVDPLVALKATTLWAAYQHFEEKTKGSIEVGKLADFVVVSDNPLTIDRARLADIQVLETIKEGTSVYTRR